MTLDPRAEMTLELSRRAQEPSALDSARNLAALRERLGLPVPPAAGGGTVATNELPRPAEPPAPRAAAASGVAGGKIVPLAGVAVLAAALGFLAGSRVDRATMSEPAAPAIRQPAAQQRIAQQAVPGASPALARRESEAARADTSAASSLAEPEHGSPPGQTAAEVKRKPARRDTRREPGARSTKRTPAAEDTSFSEAVRLLRRARRALSKGEPQLTLALLDELDARFPRALLDEERDATRVLGLCAHGQPAAAEDLARRLLARHPRSIYTPRLAQSCASQAMPSANDE